MSTHITSDEYPDLIPVPVLNWRNFISSYPCDVHPAHGRSVVMLQTCDHRSIVLCEGCYCHVVKTQQRECGSSRV
jgi:hypothetical protein